jgi:hypothetical protein
MLGVGVASDPGRTFGSGLGACPSGLGPCVGDGVEGGRVRVRVDDSLRGSVECWTRDNGRRLTAGATERVRWFGAGNAQVNLTSGSSTVAAAAERSIIMSPIAGMWSGTHSGVLVESADVIMNAINLTEHSHLKIFAVDSLECYCPDLYSVSATY